MIYTATAPLQLADVSNFHLSFILMTPSSGRQNKKGEKMICVLCLEELGSVDEKKMKLIIK